MSKPNQPAKQTDFQQLVGSIRSAESESDRVRGEYDAKIAELLKKAREKTVEMREGYAKKAEEEKEKVLSAERAKTEKEVGAIVAEAKKQAAGVKAKALSRKALEEVFDSFSSSL